MSTSDRALGEAVDSKVASPTILGIIQQKHGISLDVAVPKEFTLKALEPHWQPSGRIFQALLEKGFIYSDGNVRQHFTMTHHTRPMDLDDQMIIAMLAANKDVPMPKAPRVLRLDFVETKGP